MSCRCGAEMSWKSCGQPDALVHYYFIGDIVCDKDTVANDVGSKDMDHEQEHELRKNGKLLECPRYLVHPRGLLCAKSGPQA